ncbi:reticulon-like protein B11 [Cynara cardunculus var. scolymus]|uniref:Reticulon-like protein n=1 Tax=Cynara cardunculus var. scolymus TaxID=59895 RepID=A0A103YKL3_CYNCS|nr:reticulon-like protein B11 [Cynara cardunculus var. scolymus]KVI10809.1 Reticulon [Cynara cardunculus var. scolymus]
MGDFGRISVHDALGGGPVADILLWRNSYGGGVVLIGSTILWFLFERGGYNVLAFIANNLLLLVVILFFWAKSASLLNRPLPPIPELDISEESVLIAADEMHVWVNHAFLIAHEIAVDGNVKALILVVSSLWLISYIGSFFNFLTMIYIGVLLSLSVPFLYDKFQAQVDEKLIVAHKIVHTVVRQADIVLQMIPTAQHKQKKNQ